MTTHDKHARKCDCGAQIETRIYLKQLTASGMLFNNIVPCCHACARVYLNETSQASSEPHPLPASQVERQSVGFATNTTGRTSTYKLAPAHKRRQV